MDKYYWCIEDDELFIAQESETGYWYVIGDEFGDVDPPGDIICEILPPNILPQSNDMPKPNITSKEDMNPEK